MNIAVLLKEVPDTYGDRDLNLETGLTDRSGDVVADEVCERAVEAAMRLKEARGDEETTVDLITVGPETAHASVRKGIAMGADDAYIIADDALLGADVTLTAEVLAAALRKQDYDLVVLGTASSDGGDGVMAGLLAELLGWPAIANATDVTLDSETVTATQVSDHATLTLEAQLPALVAVSDEYPDARFPNFKGLMAAKKKELHTLTLAELGVDAEDFARPRAIMVDVEKRPARERGEIIDYGPNAVAQLVDFLAEKHYI